MPKRTTARRAHEQTINDALTREGTRVRYAPGTARPRPSTGLPKVGELGTTELTLKAGRRKVYDPEVGGGVVYVRWDKAGLFSVPPSYLRVVRSAADPDPGAGAEKARRFVDEEGARTLAQHGAGRICPEVNDSRDTSRPIIPTVHRELVRLGLVRSGGRNLDLGGGKFEKATGFMAENGVTSMVVDPSRTPEHNDAVWRSVRGRPVDSVTVANVLNVICDAKARQELIGVAAGAVRPGGIVAFQIYDGDKSGIGCKTTDGWQEHRKPPTYLAEIQRWFGRVERKDNIFYAYGPRARPVGEIPPDAPMKECGAKRKKNPGGIDVLATQHPDEQGFVVLELSAGLDRRTAGSLELRRMDDEDVSGECLRHVRSLRRRHPERSIGVLVVSSVRVEPWARGRGVGVALYVEAARLAASRFASMIIAHECVEGQTSVEAERVWESSRFREQVDVVGRAAYAV